MELVRENPEVGRCRQQIAAFGPTPEMQERLRTLLAHHSVGELTPVERTELDEYERIEHLVMIKA
jgi:hypothetical protein